MAYVNLVSVACTDKKEFFCRFRDFLCKRNGTYDYSTTGIGWTLHDSSYATDEDNPVTNDYFVAYSPGEDGEQDLYFKITYVASYIKIGGWLSWDASTHAGGISYYAGNNFTLHDVGAKTLWLYGDLDMFSILNKVTTGDYDCVFAGKLEPSWDDQEGTVATCSSTLAAGSDVSITVDSVPSEWAVGREIYIRTTHNNATSTVKIEKITIKTLVGSVITADLTNSYTAGSALSDHVGYVVLNSTNLNGGIQVVIGEDGVSASRTANKSPTGTSGTYFDPGSYEDRFCLTHLQYESGTTGLVGKLKNIKWTPNYITGFTYEDILEELDGTQWRSIKCYAGAYFAFKEV